MPSHSLKVAWNEDDVLKNRDFDYSKRFLPNRLAGVDEIACLDQNEKLKLNQIIGNAYCHIFAFVEEFIVPQTLQEASETSTVKRRGCAHCSGSRRKRSSISRCSGARWRRSRRGSASSAA